MTRPANRLIFLALLTVQILFGINYVISKVLVEAFPPLVWASLRMTIAAALIVLFAVFAGKARLPSRRLLLPIAIFALLGVVVNQGCFLVGLRYTTSTNSAILNTLIPVFTLIVLVFRREESLTKSRVLGFLSASAGVLVLLKVENFRTSWATAGGDVLTLINCLSFSLYLSLSKRFMEEHDALVATSWLFVVGSLGLDVASIGEWRNFHWPAMTPTLWACGAYATIGATIFSNFLNNWLLGHVAASRLASYIYLQPLVAFLLSYLWLNESLTARVFLSGILIVAGVFLTSREESRANKYGTKKPRPPFPISSSSEKPENRIRAVR